MRRHWQPALAAGSVCQAYLQEPCCHNIGVQPHLSKDACCGHCVQQQGLPILLPATAIGMAGNLKSSYYCWLLEHWDLCLHRRRARCEDWGTCLCTPREKVIVAC